MNPDHHFVANYVPDYRAGDRIAYRTFGHIGTIRIVDVDRRYDDVKDGKPGFDGHLVASTAPNEYPGPGVWGYDDQIVPVLP